MTTMTMTMDMTMETMMTTITATAPDIRNAKLATPAMNGQAMDHTSVHQAYQIETEYTNISHFFGIVIIHWHWTE
jgi:hypothetical protein